VDGNVQKDQEDEAAQAVCLLPVLEVGQPGEFYEDKM